MKHTPAIDRALARAKTVRPETDPLTAEAENKEPGCAYARTLHRLEQHLKHCAASFEERERHNDLYRYYVQKRDRTNAHYYRPSQLQDSTTRIKERLLSAYRDLKAFENMPIAPNVGTITKRWRKSERFFRLLDIEKEIRRQGGKVRHAARPLSQRGTHIITEPWDTAPRPATEQPTFI